VTDLVIQSFDLPTDAIDAFRVACLAPRVRRKLNSARLLDVPDDVETRKVAAALAAYWKCDAAFVPSRQKLADFRLLAIDMDSTLVNIETLDEVAAYAGKGREVAAITEAAVRGEVADYKESLRRRVAMLAGVDGDLLQRVYDEKMRLNPGVEVLLAACKAAGLKTLLVTGGLRFYAERLKQRLEFDFTCANELEIVGGRLTGRVRGPPQNGGEIVDAAGKARALRETCAAIACLPQQAIAIGDGANDLAMMKLAGMSVAYRARPIAQQQAAQALNYTGLDGVLTWFNGT
jgi:phosphoserine phosphatase